MKNTFNRADIVRLGKLMEDENASVRGVVIEDICVSAVGSEACAVDALPILAKALEDDDMNVFSKAAHGLALAGEKFPDLLPFVIDSFGDMAVALNDDARLIAVTHIAEIAKNHPEHSEKALLCLSPALIDRDPEVMRIGTALFKALNEEFHEYRPSEGKSAALRKLH